MKAICLATVLALLTASVVAPAATDASPTGSAPVDRSDEGKSLTESVTDGVPSSSRDDDAEHVEPTYVCLLHLFGYSILTLTLLILVYRSRKLDVHVVELMAYAMLMAAAILQFRLG